MKIRVLGCYGGQFPGFNLTSFLIEENLLLDTGAVTSVLKLEEQAGIKNILISHAHLDHIKDMFFLADNIYALETAAVNVYAVDEVIEALKEHISNNIIWPDFTKLKAKDFTPLNFNPIARDKMTEIDGFLVKPIRVNHPVPTFGYIITKDKETILYTADTRPTDEIWQEANNNTKPRAIIVDVSKYFTKIKEINEQERYVIVEPAVVRDELNLVLKKYGFHFAPETSTSNRAMMAGMVGNNSSGSTSIKYGVTRDKILSLKAILSDGSTAVFGSLNKSEFIQKTKGSSLENSIYKKLFTELSLPEVREEIIKEFKTGLLNISEL